VVDRLDAEQADDINLLAVVLTGGATFARQKTR